MKHARTATERSSTQVRAVRGVVAGLVCVLLACVWFAVLGSAPGLAGHSGHQTHHNRAAHPHAKQHVHSQPAAISEITAHVSAVAPDGHCPITLLETHCDACSDKAAIVATAARHKNDERDAADGVFGMLHTAGLLQPRWHSGSRNARAPPDQRRFSRKPKPLRVFHRFRI